MRCDSEGEMNLVPRIMQPDENTTHFDDIRVRNSSAATTKKARINMMTRRVQSGRNLTYFDDMRNREYVTVETRPDSAVQRVDGSFRLAHMLSFFFAPPSKDPNLVGVSIDLAGLLAIHHFNTRSGAILPYLPEHLKDRDLYITMDLVTDSIPNFLSRLPRDATLAKPAPMGILGTGNSGSSENLAILGGVNNAVQCSPAATSPELNDRSIHPFFTRTIPTNLGNARAAVQYLQYLGLTHVASLHVGDVYGREFALVLQGEAEKAGIDVYAVSFELGQDQDATQAVQQIKASGRKYILGLFFQGYLRKIADVAAPAGIMGQDGYVWILGEGDDNISFKPALEDRESRLRDTNGIGWIAMDVPHSERYNAILESFKKDEVLQQYYISRKVRASQRGSTLIDLLWLKQSYPRILLWRSLQKQISPT